MNKIRTGTWVFAFSLLLLTVTVFTAVATGKEKLREWAQNTDITVYASADGSGDEGVTNGGGLSSGGNPSDANVKESDISGRPDDYTIKNIASNDAQQADTGEEASSDDDAYSSSECADDGNVIQDGEKEFSPDDTVDDENAMMQEEGTFGADSRFMGSDLVEPNASVTAGTLNIRTDAGTDNPKITVFGNEYALKLGDRIEIVSVKNGWFHILADTGDGIADGYVDGTYVTPDEDSGYDIIMPPLKGGIPVDTVKYKDYDNVLREWWYVRSGDHTLAAPGFANEIARKFPRLDTFYANTNVKPDDKVMYLTFDVGYENGYTTKILDTLKKHNVKVCFFVTSSFINTSPETAKRMKEEGHIVGNHTKTHPCLVKKSDEEIIEELTSVEELFKEKTGYDIDKYMRPPMGDFSERTLKIQQDLGYKTIFWSLAIANDWDNSKQDQINSLARFKADHHSGCIALVHATSRVNANSLDDILTFLEGEGYRFGTLDELE